MALIPTFRPVWAPAHRTAASRGAGGEAMAALAPWTITLARRQGFGVWILASRSPAISCVWAGALSLRGRFSGWRRLGGVTG